MPHVTAVKLQKNKKRANVYLDGKFGFGIDLENLLKLKIKEGQYINESEIEKIVGISESQKIWDRLLRFVSTRPKSEKEVRDWFLRKKVTGSLADKYLRRLKRLDFIDDLKFALWWIEQRLSFRPKPKKIIEQELKVKGVKKEIIDKAFSSFQIDEYGQAKAVFEKNKLRWKNLPPDKFRIKASGFLLRRGYSWEVVKKVLSLEEE